MPNRARPVHMRPTTDVARQRKGAAGGGGGAGARHAHLQTERLVVPMGADLAAVREQLAAILTPVLQGLQRSGVIASSDPDKINSFLLVRMRELFMAWPEARKQLVDIGAVFGDLGVASALVHGYGLLHQHGLGPLYAHLKAYRDDVSEAGSRARSKQELLRRPEFQEFMRDLDRRVRAASALRGTRRKGARAYEAEGGG